MNTMLRGALVALMLMPAMPLGNVTVAGHRGSYRGQSYNCASGYCYTPTYYKPEPYVAPAATTTSNSTTTVGPTYQYTFNYGTAQVPQDQGNTVYGASTVADVYGTTDVGALFAQASRLTADSGAIYQQGLSGFQALVAQEGQQRARVAEIIAKGQSASQVLTAAAPSPSAHLQQYQQGGDYGYSAPPAPGYAESDQVQYNQADLASLEQKCARCHTEQTKSQGAGLVISLDGADATMRRKIIARVFSPDPAFRMPKNMPELTPGERAVVLALCVR